MIKLNKFGEIIQMFRTGNLSFAVEWMHRGDGQYQLIDFHRVM